MKQRRIVIVNGGIFKENTPNHYVDTCNFIRGIFEKIKMIDETGRDTDDPAAIVTVVETEAEARNLVVNNKVDIVIFVSATMYGVANKLQSDFPGLWILNFIIRPLVQHPYLVPLDLVTLEGVRQMILE